MNHCQATDRNERLRKAAHPFGNDLGVWKEGSYLTFSQEPYLRDDAVYLCGGRTLKPTPRGGEAQDSSLEMRWEPVDERGRIMRLDRKTGVGRLDIVPTTNPAGLGRELALIVPRSDVLNHTVRERYIKTLVGEWDGAAIAVRIPHSIGQGPRAGRPDV